MKIDLGGGLAPKAGHVNLDPVHGQGAWKRNAQDIPWPRQDATVEAIHASHVMEHIHAGTPRIAVLNEAWRVLRPGGTLTIIVPYAFSWQGQADPTHVSNWVPESFRYLDGSFGAQADYGLKPWRTLKFHVRDGWELNWVGVKLTPETLEVSRA